MFELNADKNKLTLAQQEMMTSGSVGVYQIHFTFSPEWEGLSKTAVFYGVCKTVSVVLDDTGQCSIPWEVLTISGQYLYVGVQGKQGEDIVLPTDLVNLGLIHAGAAPGEDIRPPTPELWEQLLAQKGDRLDYTPGGELGLYSGDKLLSDLPIEGGGGEGTPSYQFGHGLKVTGRIVSVDAVNDFKGDNTLPMTAAGVQTTVGNIEALLGTV